MASSGNFVETRREEREQSIMREIRHPSNLYIEMLWIYLQLNMEAKLVKSKLGK
jgi:hypothetical protein